MRASVTITYLDETTTELRGELAPLADRVKFEHRFGVSAAVLQRLEGMFDEEGNLNPGADPSDLHEEYIAFLVWAMVWRQNPGVGEFDDWISTVGNLDLNTTPKEAADPTVTAAAPPS